MNPFQRQVAGAVRAITFTSRIGFAWFGKMLPPLHRTVRSALTDKNVRDYLFANLQSRLYANFYCPGVALPERSRTPDVHPVDAATFIDQLSLSNGGAGYWDENWTAVDVVDGKVLVRRDGLELWARRDECSPGQGTSITVGSRVKVRFPKEFLNLTPGFYMALGNREMPPRDPQVRLYWNISPKGSLGLMRSITTLLNAEEVPFRFKVLEDQEHVSRCDGAVLYTRKSDFGAVRSLVEHVYADLAHEIKAGIPALTKPLAPGLGLAEDPGDGDSFGLHRSSILAEGVLRAREQGQTSVDERLLVVESCFEEHGISLSRPYLNAGSTYEYGDEMPGRGVVIAPPPEKIVPRRGNNYLRVALRIAERLSREAIWHEDRCNWLGFGPDKASGISGGRQFSALGPDLYGGTSGVAIFLAEAHAVAEDLSIRHAALGAMRQALSTSDQVPADVRPGLYSGWTGIAYAGVRVGRLLGEDAMVRRAVDLLGRLRRERMQRWDFDLMSGRSGAITGILAIRDRVEGDWVTGFALRLGKELHRTADRTDRGWSWKSVLVPHPRNLTGLSHGAAGAGHALSELAHATGDSRCRQAAEGAFEYERRWFDPEAGNWPDFREEPGYLNRRRPPYAFTCTWCHGAAGIALTRLRAYELWKDPACRAEALAALKTTRDSLQRPEEFGSGNYSLCHGLAGNGEVLMYGSRVMGKEASDALSSAQEVAEAGVKSYADPDRPWPCGSGVGETPGLMLGLAGIGHFYLTMNSPETPSVLLLRPWDFSGKRSRG